MFKLYCNKNDAFFQETAILTSGRVGEQISFTFSPDWDGLLKTAVFIAGKTSKDVVLTEDNCNIPPEVLVFPGEHLRVGVFGETADKTLVIPTIYASAGTIRPGASPSGMTSSPPSPSWTEQVHAIALEAKEVADSVRDDADAGKYNGTDGGWYAPEVTQPDANTMRFAFTPSKEGMPEVPPKDISIPGGGGTGGSGEDGGYYAPAVDAEGNLTWAASKTGMPDVPGTNIKGPKGDTGDTGPTGPAGTTGPQGPAGPAGAQGPAGTAGADGAQGPAGADGKDGADGADGKSAYAYAQEGGFTGTEAEFAAKLAAEIPSDDHINELIDTKLGVIENGAY